MSEIAACTLIQEEPDRKTERYLTMFKDYPDVVTVEHLQEMLLRHHKFRRFWSVLQGWHKGV